MRRRLAAVRRGAAASTLAFLALPVLYALASTAVVVPHAAHANAGRSARDVHADVRSSVTSTTPIADSTSLLLSCAVPAPGVHRTAPGGVRTVALTFDDGPGRDTARIIAILKAAHVTASFFNLGVHEQQSPSLVQTEAAAGYAMGDHTWDHQTLTTLSASQQASEMDRERAVHAQIVHRYPCLFRPPGGAFNSTTLTLANQRRMAVWNWSVDTEDWKAAGVSDPFWINRIRTRAQAGASQLHPVILLHNQVGGNPSTVAALPSIIAFYKARHYRFVDLFGSTGLPTVTSLDPTHGPIAGGTRVHVYGSSFNAVRSVEFGGIAGGQLKWVTSTHLVVTAPKHAAGVVSVVVRTSHGNSAAVHYRYVAPPPPPPPTPVSTSPSASPPSSTSEAPSSDPPDSLPPTDVPPSLPPTEPVPTPTDVVLPGLGRITLG